jgi:glycosyltransferase involved in cell wall biosynthesis
MKIAVFHNLPPGGAKRTLFEELKFLSKKHEIELFELTSTDESYLNLIKIVKKVSVYDFYIDSRLPGFAARLAKDYKNFVALYFLHKKIADAINKGGFDVAFVHADLLTQAPYILRFLQIPSLYFCQEYLRLAYEPELAFKEDVPIFNKVYEEITRKIRKEIDRCNAKHATKILANSNFTKRNCEKAFGRRAETCHLGVDTKIFKPSGRKRGDYILVIGEKNSINGYKFAQKVLSHVKKKSGHDLKIKTLGVLTKGVQINDDGLLSKFYSEALATLCVSHNEPFGLAPLESMACQTPVVAVSEGGYKETVKDGKTGYMVKREAKAISEKLLYLIEHPDRLELMGKKGRQHIIKNFGWERHNKQVEHELLKLAKSP